MFQHGLRSIQRSTINSFRYSISHLPLKASHVYLTNRFHSNETTMKTSESKKLVKLALAGNMVITVAKLGAWLISGSSSMLSEAIHSLVDSGNQFLLYVGLQGSDSAPDKAHQYGYGKQIYFWSLVSALGTFWCGAGISGWNSLQNLANPSLSLDSIGWEVYSVLGISFAVDGFVFVKTIKTLFDQKPDQMPFMQYLSRLRDPTTAAVLMEDGAACVGILIACAGIGATKVTGLAVFDAMAGLGIAGILGMMGLYLARLNQKYLLGQAVDPEITNNIKQILLERQSIDEVHSEQSQWVGPYAFSYKAEVDFDGTFLAAKLLQRYEAEFTSRQLSKQEVRLLLSWYAEDVMRTVEQEVKDLEEQIRNKYPEAVFIELEPDSRIALDLADPSHPTYAIDAENQESMRRIEIDTLNQLQESMASQKKQLQQQHLQQQQKQHKLLNEPKKKEFYTPPPNPIVSSRPNKPIKSTSSRLIPDAIIKPRK